MKTKPSKKFSKFPESEKLPSKSPALVLSSPLPRVHLLYNSTMRKADTRCGTGDKKKVTTKLREVTCPLCQYWAGKS